MTFFVISGTHEEPTLMLFLMQLLTDKVPPETARVIDPHNTCRGDTQSGGRWSSVIAWEAIRSSLVIKDWQILVNMWSYIDEEQEDCDAFAEIWFTMAVANCCTSGFMKEGNRRYNQFYVNLPLLREKYPCILCEQYPGHQQPPPVATTNAVNNFADHPQPDLSPNAVNNFADHPLPDLPPNAVNYIADHPQRARTQNPLPLPLQLFVQSNIV